MKTLFLTVLVMMSGAGLFVNRTHAQGISNDNAELMSVHLFNIPASKEQELVAVMSEFNKLFSILGFPDVKYKLWKVAINQEGSYTYLWNSVWPNQDAYNKVHQNEDYRDLLEKHRTYLENIASPQVYNHYEQVVDLRKK